MNRPSSINESGHSNIKFTLKSEWLFIEVTYQALIEISDKFFNSILECMYISSTKELAQ